MTSAAQASSSRAPVATSIERNYIGTDADGLVALPNRADGIFVDNSPNNVIGECRLFFNGNLISGNSRFGVMLNGTGQTGTRISAAIVSSVHRRRRISRSAMRALESQSSVAAQNSIGVSAAGQPHRFANGAAAC